MYLSLVSLVATLSDSGAALLTFITHTHSDHSLDSPTSDSFICKQEICLLVSKCLWHFLSGLDWQSCEPAFYAAVYVVTSYWNVFYDPQHGQIRAP